MKLHELKIVQAYLVDITIGTKTFELRKNDRDYQVGDLIRFIDIGEDDTTTTKCRYEPHIDENTLYRITYVLKDVEKDVFIQVLNDLYLLALLHTDYED